jgi:hypothetical protein
LNLWTFKERSTVLLTERPLRLRLKTFVITLILWPSIMRAI